MLFYVGTRKHDARTFRVALDPMVQGWAEDVATVLRAYRDVYADVRVFPAPAVDRLIADGAVMVSADLPT